MGSESYLKCICLLLIIFTGDGWHFFFKLKMSQKKKKKVLYCCGSRRMSPEGVCNALLSRHDNGKTDC